MPEERLPGTKTAMTVPPQAAPTVPQELAALVAAAAKYDPQAPDPRVASDVISHARSLVAIVRDVEGLDRAAAVDSAWAKLKTVTAAVTPTPDDVKAAADLVQQLQSLAVSS